MTIILSELIKMVLNICGILLKIPLGFAVGYL